MRLVFVTCTRVNTVDVFSQVGLRSRWSRSVCLGAVRLLRLLAVTRLLRPAGAAPTTEGATVSSTARGALIRVFDARPGTYQTIFVFCFFFFFFFFF